jgi:hypothetical protein
MKLLFISFLVIALAICFTTDPTPPIPKIQPIRQLINISIIFSLIITITKMIRIKMRVESIFVPDVIYIV